MTNHDPSVIGSKYEKSSDMQMNSNFDNENAENEEVPCNTGAFKLDLKKFDDNNKMRLQERTGGVDNEQILGGNEVEGAEMNLADLLNAVNMKENESKSTDTHSDVKKTAHLEGVGNLLKKLRGEIHSIKMERIVLDSSGHIYRNPSKFPVSRLAEAQQAVAIACELDGIDLPTLGTTDVQIARQMIRKKMIRCKKCKTRFVEKNLYERHLRDKHPELYGPFVRKQEEEAELQRELDTENARIDELTSGGFIPPESEMSEIFQNPNLIPLPGEQSSENTYAPNFRKNLRQMRRPYVKKVSPQCPFCDKRFKNELSLKKHFIKKHEEIGDFGQCLKCFKCVPQEEMANHHCELTYVCFECTPIRNMCTEARLIRHRNKFHRGASSGFHCKMCKMRFLTPRKLRKHMKMTHVFTETFACHFCDEICISEAAITTHERIHTGIIRFECQVCDFRCSRYSNMEEHKKKDHGYVCPICQERYAEDYEVKHHVYETHGGYIASQDSLAFVESPRTWMLYKGE